MVSRLDAEKESQNNCINEHIRGGSVTCNISNIEYFLTNRAMLLRLKS